jgi:hypothetical protein
VGLIKLPFRTWLLVWGKWAEGLKPELKQTVGGPFVWDYKETEQMKPKPIQEISTGAGVRVCC